MSISLLYNDWKCKYSHKSVVDESPFPWSLQHVVEVILEPPVPRVPAAALRAVGQRLPQQAEPGALLPLRSHRTCCGGRQETVPNSHRVIHRPLPRLHIFQCVVLHPASRWGLQPEPGAAALVAGVTSRHGITSAVRWQTGRHSHVAKRSFARGSLATLTFTIHSIKQSSGWRVKCLICSHLVILLPFEQIHSPVWTLWPSAQGWGRVGLWRSGSIETFGRGRALPHSQPLFLPQLPK